MNVSRPSSLIKATGGVPPSPNAEASALLARITAVTRSFEKSEPGARESLIQLSQTLISALESDDEFIQRQALAEPARAAHCRIAVELKLFEILHTSGEGGVGAGMLAEKTGAEESLIKRVMDHLAAMHIVGKKGVDTYTTTPKTLAFTKPEYRESIMFTFEVLGSSFNSLPNFLKRTGYKNPTDPTDGPFQDSRQMRQPFLAWLEENPRYLSEYNSYKRVCQSGKRTWCDPGFYPTFEGLIKGFDCNMSEVFLVDIGGGKGGNLRRLRENHPLVPGKLVLQESHDVLSALPAGSDAIFKSFLHDFYTPQPVKQARAYFLGSILHGRSDDDCLRILLGLKSALKPDYSKVLIYDLVIMDSRPDVFATSMDQLALVLTGVSERTELQWQLLLRRAGLNTTKIWTCPGVPNSLIEAWASSQ